MSLFECMILLYRAVSAVEPQSISYYEPTCMVDMYVALENVNMALCG